MTGFSPNIPLDVPQSLLHYELETIIDPFTITWSHNSTLFDVLKIFFFS